MNHDHILLQISESGDPMVTCGCCRESRSGYVSLLGDQYTTENLTAMVRDFVIQHERCATPTREPHHIPVDEWLGSRGASPVTPAAKRTPVQQWKHDHPEELAAYRGQHVAIHPRRGIVGAGKTMTEAHEQVASKGLENNNDIVFDFVRVTGW